MLRLKSSTVNRLFERRFGGYASSHGAYRAIIAENLAVNVGS